MNSVPDIQRLTRQGEAVIDDQAYQPPFQAHQQQQPDSRTGRPEIAVIRDQKGQQVCRLQGKPGKNDTSWWKRWLGQSAPGPATRQAQKGVARLNQQVLQLGQEKLGPQGLEKLNKMIQQGAGAKNNRTAPGSPENRQSGSQTQMSTTNKVFIAIWVFGVFIAGGITLADFLDGNQNNSTPDSKPQTTQQQTAGASSQKEGYLQGDIGQPTATKDYNRTAERMSRELHAFIVRQSQHYHETNEIFEDPDRADLDAQFRYRYGKKYHQRQEPTYHRYVIEAFQKQGPVVCVLNHTPTQLGPAYNFLGKVIPAQQVRCDLP